tara:strand:+ start:401 stop:658 length:258 start_codon:yes stop_codon:yes gene_type:complete
MEIALGAVILIGLLISWEVLKYSKQQKELEKANERYNSQNDVRSAQKKKAPKHSAKTVKAKISNSDKPKRSYKKKKKFVKKKTNG